MGLGGAWVPGPQEREFTAKGEGEGGCVEVGEGRGDGGFKYHVVSREGTEARGAVGNVEEDMRMADVDSSLLEIRNMEIARFEISMGQVSTLGQISTFGQGLARFLFLGGLGVC